MKSFDERTKHIESLEHRCHILTKEDEGRFAQIYLRNPWLPDDQFDINEPLHTRPILHISLWGQNRTFTITYCPFCGQKLEDNT